MHQGILDKGVQTCYLGNHRPAFLAVNMYVQKLTMKAVGKFRHTSDNFFLNLTT